jgi:hypothetical protein
MKIKNRTEWSTKDFQKLMNECVRREGMDNHRTVIIEYSKRFCTTHGIASVNGNWIRMFVLKPVVEYNEGSEIKKKLREFDSVLFAEIFTHELGHNRGLHHEDMIKLSDMDMIWAKEFKINLKEGLKFENGKIVSAIPKEPRNLKTERYEHALRMMKEKEQSLRRNQSLLRKWRCKVRYYERLGVTSPASSLVLLS